MLREELKDFLADKADDMKAENIQIINVEGKSNVTDFMIVCTGTSKRHVASIAEHASEEVKKMGMDPLAMDGEEQGEWVILDMGTSMLHVMQEEQRELYQLEKLWG
ncbi:ribosome silencing factor [Vibrio sp. 10N.286.49.B3]|uniref:ribosome silencing factor n=1 Tax=Vibrio sp. 10N.286.49.B3 TaxID=1880855 RepID=UPI000C858A85|nr:ribosome silencing factor [Vibrio sp. 10N.286.49.B3]PMH37485.1 ribosome silencing factor [Vibrio sp. 10N.286.49.B3]